MSTPYLSIAISALFITLPIKWAAAFTDGENTGFLACFLASLIAVFLAPFAFLLSGGGFFGFLVAYGASLTIFVVGLRIPTRRILGFAVVALALQLFFVMALISFGINLSKWLV